MDNQFIKIEPTLGSVKWLNVRNIVAIEKVGNSIKLITNANRDNHPVSYTVEASVEEFLSAIGADEIEM